MPGSDDTAIVENVGIVINVDAPVIVQNLTLITNAELRGYQTLTITGQMTWTNNSVQLVPPLVEETDPTFSWHVAEVQFATG